jgi:hypothetical protein
VPVQLPEDLNGWVALIVGFCAMVGTWLLWAWRASAYKTGIDGKFKAQGERIGAVEASNSVLSAKVSDIWKKSQTIEYNILSLTEGHGEQKARFEALIQRLDTQADRKLEQDREVIDRLARIETQLQIFNNIYAKNAREG